MTSAKAKQKERIKQLKEENHVRLLELGDFRAELAMLAENYDSTVTAYQVFKSTIDFEELAQKAMLYCLTALLLRDLELHKPEAPDL